VLRRLAGSEHAPVLVVTPADSRQGRGRKRSPPPAAEAARELGLELLQTGDVNGPEATAALRSADPEEIAVCAFGQLIGSPLLSERGMLNVHPSLIPRWRGAAPIERAIMAGDEHTGTTIMRVTEELDAGPVALIESSLIGVEDYYDDVAGRLADLGGELLVRALDLEQAGELSFIDQDESEATYAEKISPEERHLDPSRPAAALAWTVHALNPHIGTHVQLEDGERLGVRRARAVEHAPPLGMFEESDGAALVLGTAEAGLALETVQPPGKRAIAAAEFVRGYPIPSRAV
jgi:methionyl-tRNA formyltransferase